MNKRQASNIVEYILIFSFVGLVFGSGLAVIAPDTFRELFKATFQVSDEHATDSVITVGPLTD